MIIDPSELRKRYLLRLAGARDGKVYIGPEKVTVDISNSCNLHCQFCCSCHADDNPRRWTKEPFLPWAKFLGIASDCVDLKVDEICVAGGGEPTLHPRFPAMMRHLETLPIRIKLLTNAAFPPRYCADVLKADHVVINLSVSNREKYHLLHGKDVFDAVVANIKQLVNLRDRIKPACFIEVICILNVENVNNKAVMRKFVSGLGVNLLTFHEMIVHPHNQKIAVVTPGLSCAKEPGNDEHTACLNGWFSVIINIDGNVNICYRIPRMSLGNFFEMSFKDVWNSDEMLRTRLLWKNGEGKKSIKSAGIARVQMQIHSGFRRSTS